MAKKRKTLREKILAERRQKELATHQQIFSPQSPIREVIHAYQPDTPAPKITPTTAITTQNYNFLFPDLRKTVFVTGLIIVSQLVLFFIMKGH